MNYKTIIYILLNYILAMSTLLYSIIKRTSLISFMQNFLLFMISFNAVCFFVFLLVKTIMPEDEKNKFEMDIGVTEQEARDLIKDISDDDNLNEDENEKTQEEENTDQITDEDEQEYEKINPENNQETEDEQ